MPARDDNRAVGTEVERVVMMALLARQTPLQRAELAREVTDSHSNEDDALEAIESLHSAGLIDIVDGEHLIASRAARRLDGLGL